MDDRGRLSVPERLVADKPWFAESQQALMEFPEPGVIEVRRWHGEGEELLEQLKTLETRYSSSADAQALHEAWRLLDRYHVLRVPTGNRITLGAEALTHLGLPLRERTRLYLISYPSALRLLSVEQRNRILVHDSIESDVARLTDDRVMGDLS